MKSVAVVGAGISGLSISRMLSKDFKVQILEQNKKVGGLIKCERFNGNLFHKVGGHVFNSKNIEVLEWFWNHFDKDKEFILASRNAKIYLHDKYIGYPIENFIYELQENLAHKIIDELITLNQNRKSNDIEYKNFHEFLVGNFGKYLYEIYFGPYNTKIWNTDLRKVPLEWLEGKLPMPQIREVIINNIIRKEEKEMVHSSFYYPARDGSQFIVDRLSEGLNIELNFDVENITIVNDKLSINNGKKDAEIVVYCGDVRKLASILNIKNTEINKALQLVTGLKSNGTSNVLCETDENDLSWLYLPEDRYKAHRIIYTGNFSETNNEGTSRKTCVVEFSGEQSKKDMVEELKRLPGKLKPLAYNYEPNSYIIHNKDTRDLINNLKMELSKYNIFLLGRFAEWEYHNMDKCIEGAISLSRKINIL